MFFTCILYVFKYLYISSYITKGCYHGYKNNPNHLEDQNEAQDKDQENAAKWKQNKAQYGSKQGSQ